MPFCINCGVELGNDEKKCPLCSYVMPQTETRSSVTPRYILPKDTADGQLTRQTRTIITLEILSIVFVVMDVVVAGIDLFLNHRLTWSPYPMIAVTVFWIYLVLILLVERRPYITFIISASIILVFLAGIDLADGAESWFLALALPICLSSMILTFFIVKATRGGMSYSLLAVFIALAIGAEACIVDYLVSGFLGSASLSWSPIVAASMSPLIIVSLVNFFFLRRYFDAHKYLHF